MKSKFILKAYFLYLFIFFILLVGCKFENNIVNRKFIIKYQTEFGIEPESISLDENTMITEMYLPELNDSNHIFVGWSMDGKLIEPSTIKLVNNITLVACWLDIYTVTFISNDGFILDSKKVTSGKCVEQIVVPKRDNYTFIGWYSDIELLHEFDFSTKIFTNLTLYAKWKLEEYSIVYNLNGGENNSLNPNTYNKESGEIKLRDANKKGYTFSGWYNTEDFSGNKVNYISGEQVGVIELFAKWDVITYQISYVPNIENKYELSPNSYTIESESIVLFSPTREGYVFDGWYEDSSFNGEKQEVIESGTIGNKIYYAKWKIEEYLIVYNLNGGENNSLNPNTYNKECVQKELEDASRKGYKFAGWYTSDDFSGNKVKFISGELSGTLELFAKWEIITYQIIYNLNFETNDVVDPTSYTIESNTIDLASPTREGYIFNGWYEDSTFKGKKQELIETGSVGNKTYYAKWETINYSIVYKLNGGDNNSLNPNIYNKESGQIELKDANRSGYSFAGWYNTEDFSGNKINCISEEQTGDIVLFAKWDVITYQITYVLNSGTNDVLNPMSYTIESNTIILYSPTREGYIFDGWFEDESFSETKQQKLEKGTFGNKKYYAKWLKKCTIVYISDFGIAPTSINVGKGHKLKSEELPKLTDDNHLFVSWYADSNYTTANIVKKDFSIESDIVIYAKWVKKLNDDFVYVEGGSFQRGNWFDGVCFNSRTESVNSFYICEHEVTQ